MLSKNKIKQINALSLKKNRDELGLFCAEGEKCILDLCSVFHCKILIATQKWIDFHHVEAQEIIAVENENELKKISAFKTPSNVIAVFEKNQPTLDFSALSSQLSLVLDDIQDPGNLGTIVRLADWFGLHTVICSSGTADVFGAKALQATMGAVARVAVHYVNLVDFFASLRHDKIEMPVYGTFLCGNNIYDTTLTSTGLIVMGNEGKGISCSIEPYVTQRLFIPPYPLNASTSESLNVAVATAVVCSEFRRR